MYVSSDMVIDNWQRNFYLLTAIAVWVGLIGWALASPPKPGMHPLGAAVGALIIGWLPGLICAIPIIPVGYVLGHVVAALVAKGPPAPDYTLSSRFSSRRMPQDHEWR